MNMLREKLRFVSLGVLLGALLVTSSRTVEGGINSWTSNGPEGGSIRALAIDPMTPGTLYAGTGGGGVFKSTNGGGSWVNTGLTNNLFVTTLAIDPQAPATLYAGGGNGVFKSTDGGGSWTAAYFSFSVTTLAIDPQTPATLYAGTYGGGAYKRRSGEHTAGIP